LRAGSGTSHFDAHNFTGLTLCFHFQRAAAHFAISNELLFCGARIDHQFKSLSAKGTLNISVTFHRQTTSGLPLETFGGCNRFAYAVKSVGQRIRADFSSAESPSAHRQVAI
jgi:hypothetical protein